MVILRDVSAGYGKRYVLTDINLTFDKGFFGIIGPNGSGKTTLLRVISRIVKPFKGSVEIFGKNVLDYNSKELAKLVTLVSQDFYPIYDYTVYEMVLMGRVPYMGVFPFWSDEDRKSVERIMEEMGILTFRNRLFSQLSSGEKRLVMLARAIAQNTDVILVDELELHLDPKHKMFIAEYLKKLSRMDKLIISVFHDIDLAISFSDRIVGLKDGKVFFDHPTDHPSLAKLFSQLYQVPFCSVHIKGKKRLLPWYDIHDGWEGSNGC